MDVVCDGKIIFKIFKKINKSRHLSQPCLQIPVCSILSLCSINNSVYIQYVKNHELIPVRLFINRHVRDQTLTSAYDKHKRILRRLQVDSYSDGDFSSTTSNLAASAIQTSGCSIETTQLPIILQGIVSMNHSQIIRQASCTVLYR